MMQFANPFFLIGLVAVAIPIYLHLFDLRRSKRISFTNVEFIREVKQINAKQKRVQQWLVLLMRVGLIMFLVLLFAQPSFTDVDRSRNNGETFSIVVDATPSMGIDGENDESLIQEVVKQIELLGSELPNSASYDLLKGSYSVRYNSKSALQDDLDLVDLSQSARAINTSLSKIASTASLEGRQLFIFSDFQKSGFADKSLESLSAKADVHLVNVAPKSIANVFVDSVYTSDEFVRAGVNFPLHIQLRNGGALASDQVRVKVYVGQIQAGSFTVSLPAGQTSSHSLPVRLQDNIPYQCRVEVEDATAAFDNTYYFLLTPAGKIGITHMGANEMLLRRVYTNEQAFRYSSFPVINASDFSSSQLVVLQEANGISQTTIRALREFVSTGGTLVIVPSANQSSRSGYTELFAELGLGTIRWSEAGASGEKQELAAPDQQQPFFKDVFAQQTRQADMPAAVPVLGWSRSSTDILEFKNGSAFLSGFRSGQGMVYVFAAPFASGYSSFAAHPLFVPVMYRLASASYRAAQLPAYHLTDRAVVLGNMKAPEKGAEAVYKLVKDSTTLIPAQQIRGGKLYLQLPKELQEPGFYALTLDDKTVATLAFNSDKAESELSYYSTNELKQLTARYPNVHVYDAGAGKSMVSQYQELQSGSSLWRWCLLGALLCLLGEGLVIRYGRRRALATAQVA